MSKEIEEIKNIVAIHFGALGFLNPSENKQILKDRDKVLNALTELKAIKEANPSEALEWIDKHIDWNCKKIDELKNRDKGIADIYDDENKMLVTIKQVLLKAQEQENENEILKEIIKSFFEKGSPLHQYIDEDGALTIEVDDECSIMRLGEFKGVELDKKLEEVLKNGKRI